MITARDLMVEIVKRTDEGIRGYFDKSEPFIRFHSGRSQTIENEVTLLTKSAIHNPFPLVALFTEGVSESFNGTFYEFRIPKMAIIIRTKINTTEAQKLNDSFKAVLHPIYSEFEKQVRKVHLGYNLNIEHSDLPCMHDATKATSLNQLCDAVIIKNLRIKYYDKKC